MPTRISTFINLALLLLVLALSAVLAYTAINDRIYYVGTRTSGTAMAGEVPESTLRDFALLYVNSFETFTPATLADNDQHLQRLIHPRHYGKVSEMLNNRRELVAKGKITSMFVPTMSSVRVTPKEGSKYEVLLSGSRKIYLSDELNQHVRIQYRVVIQAAAPTFSNPFGLFVVGHGAQELKGAGRE